MLSATSGRRRPIANDANDVAESCPWQGGHAWCMVRQAWYMVWQAGRSELRRVRRARQGGEFSVSALSNHLRLGQQHVLQRCCSDVAAMLQRCCRRSGGQMRVHDGRMLAQYFLEGMF
jgi:hypothetical protein